MNATIRSVGAFLPVRRVTNDHLAERIDTSDEWIRSHTGIGARHIAGEEEFTSDMAVKAARAALEGSGITPEELDMIIVATSTPDYIGFPSTSSIVQDKLGATRCGAFDLRRRLHRLCLCGRSRAGVLLPAGISAMYLL